MPQPVPNELNAIVLDVLSRAPNWLRRDLASDHAGPRKQAEETLAAMLAAALGKATGSD